MANFLKELSVALQNGGLDEVPPEWKTTNQYAEESGFSGQRTAELLKRGVNAGLIEIRKFRVLAGGRPYPVPHYRRKP